MLHPLRRAVRLAGVGVLASATFAAAAVALPVLQTEGTPGRLVDRTIALSGQGAVARKAATAARTGPAQVAPRTVSPGWSADVAVEGGTQMVGLTWSGAATGAAQVRALQADGTWTDWSDLDADPDEGPDAGGNGRTGAGPMFLGHDGTDAVQVRVTGGRLTDLRMEAMRWIPPTTPAGGAGAEPAGPAVHPRSEWAPGGWVASNPDCTPAPVVNKQLRFAVVHHTVDSNSYSQGDVPGILAGTYRFHTQGRGWCDIAYNFLIDKFGRVWEGRSGGIDQPIMGGHAKGFNTDSVGVAFIGQYQPGASPAVGSPSAASISALEDLLAWKLSIHEVNPQATIAIKSNGSTKYAEGTVVNLPTIQGHRDSSLTSCPGDNLYPKLPSIRSAVAQRIAAGATPSKWKPFTTGQSFFRQQFADAEHRLDTNGQAGFLTSLVVRSGQLRDPFVQGIVLGATADARMAGVARLYQAAFVRRADTGGLRYWVGRRDAGLGTRMMAKNFAASKEFADHYGTLDDRAFVRQIYVNVLQREPDAGGWDYWTNRLASIGRGGVLDELTRSKELVTRMKDESTLIDIWFALLNRMPDPSAFDYWLPKLKAGSSPLNPLREVLGSAEYANRF